MAKVAMLVAVLGAAALTACYNPRYPGDAPGTDDPPQAAVTSGSGVPVTSRGDGAVTPWQPGFGRIESISVVPAGASAAGGTAPAPRGYQITVRMDNGTVQSIVQDNPNFRVGDRVEITREGRVILI